MGDKKTGQPQGVAPTLREQLQGLIAEYGHEPVTEELMKILEKYFRRQELAAAAERYNLVPHTAEAVKMNNN